MLTQEQSVLLVSAAGVLLALLLVRRIVRRERSEARLFDEPPPPDVPDAEQLRGLQLWLVRAGYRSSGAPAGFLLASGAGLAIGIGFALSVHAFGLVDAMLARLEALGGPLASLSMPVVLAGPTLVGLVLAAVPYLRVRAERRRRQNAIEQEAPLVIELLATLAEAGLAFDAAVDRMVEGRGTERPLLDELRVYQYEMLGGVQRDRSLRRLAQRVDVPAVSVLVSALVQAYQVGSSVAEALHRQAEDARARRRERALTLARALPVKLVFPLVLCLLPGVFVTTLGPAFHQFYELADAVIRGPQDP